MIKEKNNIFIYKFLPILIVAMFVINIFFSTTAFGATYDLSDYKNHDLKDGVWCIVYSKKNEKFHLIVGERSDYRYLFCSTSTDDEGNIYPSGSWSTMRTLGNYNAQGGAGCYTFNTETSKFEDYAYYGIGGLNLGECEVIASGVDVYTNNGWTSFFRKTPVPSQVVIQPILMETVTQALEEMIQKITTNLQKIIQVGLVILSIGLLIFLIKSVILQAK